jgi:hypothetical protein
MTRQGRFLIHRGLHRPGRNAELPLVSKADDDKVNLVLLRYVDNGGAYLAGRRMSVSTLQLRFLTCSSTSEQHYFGTRHFRFYFSVHRQRAVNRNDMHSDDVFLALFNQVAGQSMAPSSALLPPTGTSILLNSMFSQKWIIALARCLPKMDVLQAGCGMQNRPNG